VPGTPDWVRRIEAAALLSLSAPLQRVSVKRRLAVGRLLGDFAHAAGRGRRALSIRNMRWALGVDERRARRLTRGVFRHFGRVLVECLAYPAYIGERLEEFFQIEGIEHLLGALDRGRGVIVCSAHIGNWELAGARQNRAGVPTDYIARPLANRWLYEHLEKGRAAGGSRSHDKHGAVRSAMKVLREGRALAFMIDQNMTGIPRVFVPFFGRLASTSPALGHLSLRIGAAIVPAYTVPHANGTYTFRYLPELTVSPEGDLDERVWRLTADMTRLVEDWVRERPDTWLWLHNRWKTQPGPGEVP
jgi:KDO2-lipid IV(A) lauroyltransferase